MEPRPPSENLSPKPGESLAKDKAQIRRKWVPLLILLGVVVGLAGFLAGRKVLSAGQVLIAQRLVAQGKCTQAVPILHTAIRNDPKNAEAYLQRATCYGSTPTNVFEERYQNLVYAIYDLDSVIALRPGVGDYYVDKELIFRELANIMNDSASEFMYYELATHNAEIAMQLGVSPGFRYIFRHHARNLIESGHCEEGLQETLALIDQAIPQDPNMDNYNIYLTEAYLCLGDLEQALQSAENIQCDDPVATCRSGFLAEIYYQMGKTDKAFDVLNGMIAQNPAYGGWRYFLRAAIYYERGEEDLAVQDLATGEAYTWSGNGVYWYLKARQAFDAGDAETGATCLQYAETTLDVQYNPLRWQIQEEMKALGVEPLKLVPQLPPGISFLPE